QWVTGLRHNGTGVDGFRTNVSLYNLRQDRDSVVTLRLYGPQGQLLKELNQKSLAPLGYEQHSLMSLFGLGEPPGVAALRLLLGPDSDVGVNVSVVDNRTGDPSLQTNELLPSGSVLVIPGVARLAGASGSQWRSSLVLTNPDSQGRSFTVKFIPRNAPALEKPVALNSWQTVAIQDVVSWIAEPYQVPDNAGVLLIFPSGGVFPAVSARTYNLAADGGTYGQTLKAFHVGNSAGGSTGYRRLYLTGMASEDTARTNLGFVHVEGDTVNFKVWFYDEGGNLLNPNNRPYTLAVSRTNPWDQDKLENRFRNFFGVSLPASRRVISAIMEVEGGVGQAYASVVDNKTNDPIFIPAVAAP
ncbi:MAG: hypothetical protein RMI39_07195, partial [Thermoanaerobaculum sp.]|nr:hypothetical protein [Thermoanaerobaculum sp.]